jgi:plasmid stabilization system protein ParE
VRISVRIEPTAERQLEFLAAWWRENRRATPSLKELLREAFKRIRFAPHGGTIYTELEGWTIRRVQIKRTPYMLYYYVDEMKREAVIITAWSAERGAEPLLELPPSR